MQITTKYNFTLQCLGMLKKGLNTEFEYIFSCKLRDVDSDCN